MAISNSRLRLGGMISGLDTDALVKSLLQTQQNRIDKVFQQKRLLEYKKEAQNNVTKLLETFRNDFLSMQKQATSMVSSLSYKQKVTNLQTNNYLTVTSNSDANVGSYVINSVKSVASGASYQTVGRIDVSTGTKLADLANITLEDLDSGEKGVKFSINGKSYEFTGDTTLSAVMSKINQDSNANLTFTYSAISGKFTLESKNKGITPTQAMTDAETEKLAAESDLSTLQSAYDDAVAQYKTGSYAVTIGNNSPADFTGAQIDDEITRLTAELETESSKLDGLGGPQDVVDKIAELNEELNSYKTARTDVIGAEEKALEDGKTRVSTATAAHDAAVANYNANLSDIEITQEKGDFFKALGIGTSKDSSNLSYKGPTDAVVVVNGYEIKRNSNTFSIDGMTFNLTKATPTDGSYTPLEFNVSQSIEEPFKRISEFVNKYNELVEKLNGLLKEAVYRSYPPLTDAQKEEMSEKEIELWDEKAKSGAMYNDSRLSGLVSSMRSAFSEVVGDTGKSLAAIGIKVASYYEGGSLGKLTIDETRLKEALSSNPDEVMNLFTAKSGMTITKDSTSAERNQHRKYSGVITRMTEAVNTYISNINYDVIQPMNDRIKEYTDKISALEKAYTAKEEALWAKYSAMEQTLSTLNSQSSWIGSNM